MFLCFEEKKKMYLCKSTHYLLREDGGFSWFNVSAFQVPQHHPNHLLYLPAVQQLADLLDKVVI